MDKKLNTDFVVTAVVWFFLGCLGIHRFIHGKVGTGILMLLTLGGLGIWWIVDGIIIFMQNFEDKNGNSIKMYSEEKLEKNF